MKNHSYRSMAQVLGEKCNKCGGMLHKTNLQGRLFCRTCWEYRDNQTIKG